MNAPVSHHPEGMQSHLQRPRPFWGCSVQGPVGEEEIQVHCNTGTEREAEGWALPPGRAQPQSPD